MFSAFILVLPKKNFVIPQEIGMNTVIEKKAMHPFKKFIIELLSARAGLHIKQHSKG